MLALYILVLSFVTAEASNVIFEEGSLTIKAEMDLTVLDKEMARINGGLEFLSKLDLTGKIAHERNGLYNRLALRHDSMKKKLTNYDMLIAEEGRQKRSIELIGEVWHEIGGIPSGRMWETEEKRTLALERAISTQNSVNDNLLETSRLIEGRDRKQDRAINDTFMYLGILSKAAKSEKLLAEQRAQLTVIESKMDFLLTRAERYLEGLFHILDKGKQNIPSEFAMPPTAIRDCIEHNAKQLSKNGLTPVFGTNEIFRYYTMAISHLLLKNRKLLSLVEIPLVDFDRAFELNLGASESDSFVLTRAKGKYYRKMTGHELSKCHSGLDLLVCDSRRLEIACDKLVCKRGVCNAGCDLPKIREIAHDSFVISVGKKLKGELKCSVEKHDKNIELFGTFVLFIPDSCSLSTSEFKIYGRKQSFSVMSPEFLLSLSEPDDVHFQVENLRIKTDAIIGKIEKSHETFENRSRSEFYELKRLHRELETKMRNISMELNSTSSKMTDVESSSQLSWNLHLLSIIPHATNMIIIIAVGLLLVFLFCRSR